MSDSKVFYAARDDIHALRFVGQIRYTIGPALERVINRLSLGPKPLGFLIDLRDTKSIDSTSLGLLARIAKWMNSCDAPRATLVSTNEDINELLIATGFDLVLDIVDESGHVIAFGQELKLKTTTEPEMAQVVLDAHRALMALGDDNKTRFQDVVTMLENELGHQENAVA